MDRNTRIRKGQLGDSSVEPIDLHATGGADSGDVPSLGGDGKFLWIDSADLTKEGFNEGLLADPTIEDVTGLAISVGDTGVLNICNWEW